MFAEKYLAAGIVPNLSGVCRALARRAREDREELEVQKNSDQMTGSEKGQGTDTSFVGSNGSDDYGLEDKTL